MAGVRRSLGKSLMVVAASSGLFILVGLFFLAAKVEPAADVAMSHSQHDRDLLIRSLDERERMAGRPLVEKRITQMEAGAEGYRKPIPSVDGGYDVELNLADAISKLVDHLIIESSAVDRVVRFGSSLAIEADDSMEEKDRELALKIAYLLRRRGIPAAQGSARDGAPSVVVSDRELGDFGRVLEATEMGGGGWSVMIDAEMPLAEIAIANQHDILRIGFKTDVQTELSYVRADALESLQRRLADRVWALARERFDFDHRHVSDFRRKLDERFPGAMLVDLGVRDLRQVKKVIDLGSGESVVYQAEVSWVGDEANLVRAAASVKNIMAAESREPWVRGGLALGSLILGILGWLKMDWWLKGRHAFLSKVVFGILALLGVTLSLRLPFHV